VGGDKVYVSLAKDGERRQQNKRAFEHGREIFRFVMSKRVIGIGRLEANLYSEESHHGDRDIDGGFKRIREKGN
jgi:hypothetical protein